MSLFENNRMVDTQAGCQRSQLVVLAARISLSLVWLLLGSVIISLTILLAAGQVPLLVCLLPNPLVGALVATRLARDAMPVLVQRIVFYSVTTPAAIAAILNRLHHDWFQL